MENNLQNSETYLNSVLSKKTGFSVPKNYFSTIEQGFKTKMAEDRLAKETGFNVSNAYFNGLENTILDKVLLAKKETKIISLKQKIFKILPTTIAASIILFIGLNVFLFNTEKELSLETLTDNDIEYWLDTNLIDTNDIASVLEDHFLDENDFIFTTIKDKNIEDYIYSIDHTLLFNELN